MKIDGEKTVFTDTMNTRGICAEVAAEQPLGGVWQWGLFVSNTSSEKSPQISEVYSADIELPLETIAAFCSLTGDNCGAKSFRPIMRRLRNGTSFHIEPAEGKSSNLTGFPFFDIQSGGKVYCFAIGWSGQWSLDIRVRKSTINVKIGLCDCDFYLNAGEKVRLPSVLVASGSGTVEDERRKFRRLLADNYSPAAKHKDGFKLPSALSAFDRYFQKYKPWQSEEGQMFCVDKTVELGLDTHWMDAMWFKGGFADGTGNYSCAKSFSRGLRPITDYAHCKGLRTVLWFEPERAHFDTETYLEHPEFFFKTASNDRFYIFNLGDENANEWLRNKLISLIDEFNPDFYRQDCGCHPLETWRVSDEKDRRGITEMKYIDGLYKLWDTLSERFPALIIDNCSGGGRRLDFETCRRSVALWRSDTGCSPASRKKPTDTWNQNQMLSLTRYLPYHAIGTWTVKPYEVRSAMTEGIVYNLDVYNVQEGLDEAAAKSIIAEQRRIADYWRGDFYALSEPSSSERIWAGWQLAMDGKGCAIVFRRRKCRKKSFRLNLSGIDETAAYSVTVTNENLVKNELELNGKELKNFSVSVCERNQSAVIEYSAIN